LYSTNAYFLLDAGVSQYTTHKHISLAVLEANAFQSRAILESMKLDAKTDLKHLKVDGGMTNGDFAMKVLADIGGFGVVRPKMRECVSSTQHPSSDFLTYNLDRSTALGSAILAGSAIRLFGWDITKPETLSAVNTQGSYEFKPSLSENERQKKWEGWQRAVERSKGWESGVDE
jgi:glycerol kinase